MSHHFFRAAIFCAKILMISAGASFLLPAYARAEVPTQLEPKFAEAVLAFNARDYHAALGFLDELIKESAYHIEEFLNLKALVLKSLRRDRQAAQMYLTLIQIKQKEGAEKLKEAGPYYFELATIQHRNKMPMESRRNFRKSADLDFNYGASHYFLGSMDLQDEKWLDAEVHFNETARSEAYDLRAPSYFYLAQIYSRLNDPTDSTRFYIEARDACLADLKNPALSEDNRKIRTQILDASLKALESYDRSGFFLGGGLSLGYDSNTLLVPSSLSSASQVSGQASMQALTNANAGYSSSPMRSLQLVPSYRFSYNYNFNPAAHSSEFMSHILSLFVTKDALARFSYGMKLEGTYSFNYQSEGDSGRYRPYALIWSLGPYLRYQLKPRLLMGVELFYQPQKNYQDTATGDSQRSGSEGVLKLFLQNEAGKKFWNPIVTMTLDYNQTSGSEFRSRGLELTLGDVIHLNDTNQVFASTVLSFTHFKDRNPSPRFDKLLSFQLSYTRRLSRKLSLSADLSYTSNLSTVPDTYQYTRFTSSAGIAFNF